MTTGRAARIPAYIEHILGSIGRIEAYVAGLDRQVFERNTLVQDAVIRNFEIIGEAANKIQSADPSFPQRHPHLRLDLVYRMRNALIHGYDSVNLVILWNTIQSDLPILKQQMTNLIQAGGDT